MAAESVVSIIDADALSRRALVRVVLDLELPAQAFAGEAEYWEQFDPFQPGCLLLDVGLPQGSGLELLARLAQQVCHPPVIMLAESPSVPLAVQAMQAGAHHFLDKRAAAETLARVIEQALTHDARRRREQAALDRLGQRFLRLQPGERDVLRLLVEGQSNQGVADALGVSLRTVEVRRARLLSKMHAGSLAELVRMAVSVENRSVRLPHLKG